VTSVAIFIELSVDEIQSNVHKWWNITNATRTRSNQTRHQRTRGQNKLRGPYVATYRNRTAQRGSDMPASLARAHTGLQCMHMHHYCVCLPALRPRSSRASSASPRTTTLPYRLPPRPADRVGHRPGRRPATRAKNGRTRRRARAYPRPPAPGGSELSEERRQPRARASTDTCLLPANISRCLPRSAAMAGRPARPAMHVLFAGAVPCSLQFS
jgi:hypothetical protein